MPAWNVFGIVAWVGTSRVAEKYKNLSINGFWPNHGLDLRIKVNSQSNTNMRLDFGFEPMELMDFISTLPKHFSNRFELKSQCNFSQNTLLIKSHLSI